MAFIKHHLFEVEIRDGQIIGEMPDFIRRFIEENGLLNIPIPESSDNTDNFIAQNITLGAIGGEYIPGTSGQRVPNPYAVLDAFV